MVHIATTATKTCTIQQSLPSAESSSINQEEQPSSTNVKNTHIVLPNTITRIGRPAAYHRVSDHESIQCSSFYKCSYLVSIEIPTSVTIIDEKAFFGCSSLQSIKIPPSVTKIGGWAFYNCDSLVSVDIPSSTTTIGGWAFYDCKALVSIEIPPSITEIGRYAFSRCESLLSMILPSTTHQIHIHAGTFCGCTSLKLIAIDNSTPMSSDFFYNCNILEQRKIDGQNYHTDISTWLHQRFENLPIHQACYNYTKTLTINFLSTLIEENRSSLTYADAMGMTILHILCCNPNVTAEMIKLVQTAMTLGKTQNDDNDDDNNKNSGRIIDPPLLLFLKCRRSIPFHLDEYEVASASIHSLLRHGIQLHDIECLYALKGDTVELDLHYRDKTSEMFPCMLAASLKSCELETVYELAIKCPYLLTRE